MATPPGGICVQQIGRRSIARFDGATTVSSSIAVFQNHYRQQADQMTYLKQSTASQAISLGPFVDSTDGDTTETGLTIANTDILLSKSGGASAAKNSGGATHDSGGIYTTTLDATDTNTVGTLDVTVHVSGALYVKRSFQVLEEAIYDALIGASATGFNSSGQIALLTATQASIDAIETDTSTTLQAELDAIQAAVITNAAGVDIAADIIAVKAETASILTDTAEIGAAGAGLSEAGGTGDHLTAVPWNSSWDTEVQSEVNDALVALGLDHLVSASVAGSDVADDSIIAQIVSKESTADWDDFDNTTDSLQAIADAESSPPTAAVIADAVWDETQSSHTTSGSFGEIATEIASILADTNELQVDDIPGKIAALNNISTAQVNSQVDTALADYDGPTKTEMDSAFTEVKGASWSSSTDTLEAIRDRGDASWITATGFNTTTPPTAAAIVNEWESQSQADPTGFHVNVKEVAGTAQTANDNGADINAILVDTGTTLPATLAVIDGIVDTILLDTAELQTNQSAWATATGFSTHSAADVWLAVTRTLTAATNITSDASAITMSSSGVVGTVNLANTTTTNTDLVTAAAIRAEIDSNSTQLASIVADTSELQGDDVPGLIAALNDPTSAAIATAVLTTTMTESYAADGATFTVAQGLYEICQSVSEFAIASTTKTVKKRDGTTTAASYTLDSATTPTSITRAT